MIRTTRQVSDGHGAIIENVKENLIEQMNQTDSFIKQKEESLGVAKRFSSNDPIDPRVIEANNQFANTQIIAIISINGTGEIVYSNNKAQEIFEYPKLTGASIHEFVPDNYFGSNNFKGLHKKLVKSFFSKPFVGGRMLDPGTILRAKLKSGRMLPLNIGLEAKLDPITAKPEVVVGYVTEAAAIIDQSKVEKMLARATLVVIQQFISQTVVGVFSAIETSYIPLLRYGDTTDDAEKLHKCLDYSFYKLSTEDKGGQDFKMLLFIVSTALTIAISVLPLFVNHMNDHDKDEDLTEKQKKEVFRTFALFLNDFQEHLSEWRTFRSYDIISLTVIVAISNLFLLYVLRTIPDEYGIKTLKECEETKVFEEKITLAMTWLGVIPACYLFCKELFMYFRVFQNNGYSFKVAPDGSESGTPRPPERKSISKRKGFESNMNLGSLTERSVDSSMDIDGSSFDTVALNARNNVSEAKFEAAKFEIMRNPRGSVRVSSVSSTNSDDMNLPPI
mmetsp:Transcript_16273/g.19258  ORF Transcript_16273/g.19258 Transcript_16273/m.19258 type:complete len:504 (-) Transcript_16273:73-1584(-)